MRIEPGLGETIVEGARTGSLVNGVPRQDVNLVVSEEIFQQYRQGYRCLKCYGVQSQPFPEECEEPFCSFGIKENQLRYLEAEFQGEEFYGPTPDDVLDEEREREQWTKRSGIYVPKGYTE